MSSTWFMQKTHTHTYIYPVSLSYTKRDSFFFYSTCIALHIKVWLHLQSYEGCFDVVASSGICCSVTTNPLLAINSVWRVLYTMKICSKRRPLLLTQGTHKTYCTTKWSTCVCPEIISSQCCPWGKKCLTFPWFCIFLFPVCKCCKCLTPNSWAEKLQM